MGVLMSVFNNFLYFCRVNRKMDLTGEIDNNLRFDYVEFRNVK